MEHRDKLCGGKKQVQIFTPLPSTYSSLMYFTEIDPAIGRKIFMEKNIAKNKGKKILLWEKQLSNIEIA